MLKILPTVSKNTAIAIFRVDKSDMEKAMLYADRGIGTGKEDSN